MYVGLIIIESTGFGASILRNSEFWGAAHQAVSNKVPKKKLNKSPLFIFESYIRLRETTAIYTTRDTQPQAREGGHPFQCPRRPLPWSRQGRREYPVASEDGFGGAIESEAIPLSFRQCCGSMTFWGGSGSGSVDPCLLTNGSGSRRPKNMRIRIRNTGFRLPLKDTNKWEGWTLNSYGKAFR
jgi:hypothetical protein